MLTKESGMYSGGLRSQMLFAAEVAGINQLMQKEGCLWYTRHAGCKSPILSTHAPDCRLKQQICLAPASLSLIGLQKKLTWEESWIKVRHMMQRGEV